MIKIVMIIGLIIFYGCIAFVDYQKEKLNIKSVIITKEEVNFILKEREKILKNK